MLQTAFLQRFFSEMTIDFEMIASFIFRLFFVTNGCWYLTMDRTNWIDGGGVDALLGEQTCVHKDLDIVTQEKNLEIFCASREILLFAYFLSRHR